MSLSSLSISASGLSGSRCRPGAARSRRSRSAGTVRLSGARTVTRQPGSTKKTVGRVRTRVGPSSGAGSSPGLCRASPRKTISSY